VIERVCADRESDFVGKSIGFVLLTHAKPYQTLRLARRLNTLFGAPPIVCHHDFSKCALDMGLFPSNVLFVQPPVQTRWGEFSLVEATVRALSQLHAGGMGPEWTVVLSGSCYPVKPAGQILHDLQQGDYDAHIRFQLLDAQTLPPQINTLEDRRAHVYYDRYCVKRFLIPSVDKRLRFKTRRLAVRNGWLNRHFVPFSARLRCFAGSQWFSINRRAAHYLVDYHATKPGLATYYKGTEMADESYFQTILANAPQFKLNNNNWRYMDWSAWGPHPKSLTLADLPQIVASPDHFARKIDLETNADLMNALDHIVAVPV